MGECVASVMDTGINVATKTKLAAFLQEEVDRTSLRVVADHTKVSKTAIDNITKGNATELPKLETLDKIATAYKMPLWRVVEWAGVDLGMPQSITDTVRQLTSLTERMPEIEPIVEYLLKLYPEDLRAVIAYLEVLDRRRNRDSGWSE